MDKDSTPILRQLRATLEHLAPIPDAEWAWLSGHCHPFRAPRNAPLCSPGQYADTLWFLTEGVIRFYYLTEEGKEFNKAFARAGELVGPLAAIAARAPCAYFIGSLTPIAGLKLPCSLFPGIYDRHPCWERIGRRLAELAAFRKEQRERDFLLTDTEARYESFHQRYPGLERQIAQRHIASYIGVTEVALSRLLTRRRAPA